MCLAVPMKLVERWGDEGIGESPGVRMRVMLTLTPGAKPGDYVIVHAGYALSILDAAEAQQTTALLQQVSEQNP
jgi:hydrogenase expression/formation protein HypC